MIARRLASLLPPLTMEERGVLEGCYGAAGLEAPTGRPFRAPHHTTSPAGMVGGGPGVPRPGEVTLAHHGVFFLDDVPDFGSQALEVTRHALERGAAVLSRAYGVCSFPAAPAFVVGAINDCPCGGTNRYRICTCSARQISAYRARAGAFGWETTIHVPAADPLAPRSPSSEELRARIEELRA